MGEHGQNAAGVERHGAASSGEGFDRRALLRRGGVALAGAGAAIAGVGNASPAHAAPGDPVIQGQVNDTEDAPTTLIGTAGGTLTLENRSFEGRSPLRLVEQSDVPFDQSQSGDITNWSGLMVFTHTNRLPGFVYTDVVANMLFPLSPPVRWIDTRNPGGRAFIRNPEQSLDAQFRLRGGQAIMEVDVFPLADAYFNLAVTCGNLTVTRPETAGFASIWPSGPWPGTASISYAAGQTIANFAMTGVGFDEQGAAIRIRSSAATHVILDIVAVAAGNRYRYPPEVANAAETRRRVEAFKSLFAR